MTTKEKWERMKNPQCVDDWGIGISLCELAECEPEIFAEEVSPYLPPDIVRDMKP